MAALDAARPMTEIPVQVCRELVAIAADIDDTITTEGKIPAVAFQALWDAREAGLRVVPVTGRPAGWCDHIARMWPVDGVVGENGAFYFRHPPEGNGSAPGGLIRHYVQDAEGRAANRARLKEVADAILDEVKGAALASDQAYREADLAIDFCEDVRPLAPEDVNRIVEIFRRHGCAAKISSIHVNGWFGDYDKLGMVKALFRQELGIDAETEPGRILFAGDSPNDEPMFAWFPHSAGVANIARFRDRIRTPPAYVTSRPGGEGFAELVETILAKRGTRGQGRTPGP